MSDRPTPVLLIADGSLWRDALVADLERRRELTLVGCSNLENAARASAATQAPVAIIDAHHTTSDPVRAISAVRSVSPLTRCVAVTHGGAAEHGRLLDGGAVSVVGATGSLAELTAAVVAARDGRPLLDAPSRRRLDEAWQVRRAWELQREEIRAHLTQRETEVLARLVRGHDQRAMARALSISEATVRTHIRNLLGKLGATSRLQAVAVALQRGVIQPPRPRTRAPEPSPEHPPIAADV